ncbi:hypothetical protein LZ30DRAFT_715642 [Colletotrichum cereale]|nr:hypothetical protein LZ30DRAFT_715642 [Colletotrichum cereale]
MPPVSKHAACQATPRSVAPRHPEAEPRHFCHRCSRKAVCLAACSELAVQRFPTICA